jgi:hypothetical protein
VSTETSLRVRIFFVAGPAFAIAWSAYFAMSTADARQKATQAEHQCRVQAARLDGARRVWAKLRREARAAHLAAAPHGGAAPVIGAAAVNVGEDAPPRTDTRPGISATIAAHAAAAAAAAPTSGAAGASGAAMASVAAASATTAQGEALVDPLIAARQAAAERAKLIGSLRERMEGLRVQVDEIRLGTRHENGQETVRTIRLQLSGKKDAIKKAIAQLKEDPNVRALRETKCEPSLARKGDHRVTVTGTVRAGTPEGTAASAPAAEPARL